MSKFCLLMIVKNEAHIIERAFESLKNLFDTYIICDTGSTDNTIDVINNWMALHDKKGEIIYKDWVSFGFNKSYLWEHFWNTRKDCEYLVFLDADEVFVKDMNNPLSYLTEDDVDKLYTQLQEKPNISVFYLNTIYGSLRYRRWQICRNNQLYKWLQPVHEYLVGTISNSSFDIDWIYNLARKEGASSKNPKRYEEDAQMFLDFLKNNPNDARATFYLAQTYESVCTKKSIEWYKKRIEITNNSWEQERYIACLKAGRLIKDESDKIKYLMMGTSICPERLECYYELVVYFQKKGEHNKAVGFGMMASKNRNPNLNDLFIERHIYDYDFDFIFAISCCYTKDNDKGVEANLRAKEKAPSNVVYRIDENLKFFDTSKYFGSTFKWNNDMSIVIIDNFYEDPNAIREKVLKTCEFNVKGNYPGFRTDCLLDWKEFANIKERFENIVGKKIKFWPQGYNASFQYVTEDMHSWIHRDLTEWSAVIYMTPDAPLDAGTSTYMHKELKIEKDSEGNDEEIKKLNDDSRNYDKWYMVDSVGNKFNRCILFKGKRSHQSGTYFGKDKESGRLFQTFFFDT